MWALGQIVVYHGLAVDKPIFTWMIHHQVHVLAALMNRLTKIGNTWTCWGAAFAAAVCLAATWRTKKWLPPSVLAGLIVIDHFTTLALRHVFHRLGPPTSPLGTYPSGGCDRVIVFYGLIAYLLWREFSGQRRTAICAGRRRRRPRLQRGLQPGVPVAALDHRRRQRPALRHAAAGRLHHRRPPGGWTAASGPSAQVVARGLYQSGGHEGRSLAQPRGRTNEPGPAAEPAQVAGGGHGRGVDGRDRDRGARGHQPRVGPPAACQRQRRRSQQRRPQYPPEFCERLRAR